MFDVWTDGIFPPLVNDAERIVRDDGVRLHSHAAAVNSSMVFGFNLFLPFRVSEAERLAMLLSTATGLALRVESIQFEYGPSEILAESRRDPPEPDDAWTSSDVGIEVRDASGRRGIVLVEVKLTEEGFTSCNGRESASNRQRDVCDSARRFFDEPSACYLTRTVRATRERRYWSIFAGAHGSVRGAFPNLELTGSCPFVFDFQQLMRNHALALGLVQAGHFDFARFGLVHHDDNPSVPPHWHRYCDAVADPETLFCVPASAVVEAGRGLKTTWSSAWADYVRERYRLAVGGTR